MGIICQSKNKSKTNQTESINLQLFCAIRQKKSWRFYAEIVLYAESHYSSTSTYLKICFSGDFHRKYLLVARNDQTLTTGTWQSFAPIFGKLCFFHDFYKAVVLQNNYFRWAIKPVFLAQYNKFVLCTYLYNKFSRITSV